MTEEQNLDSSKISQSSLDNLPDESLKSIGERIFQRIESLERQNKHFLIQNHRIALHIDSIVKTTEELLGIIKAENVRLSAENKRLRTELDLSYQDINNTLQKMIANYGTPEYDNVIPITSKLRTNLTKNIKQELNQLSISLDSLLTDKIEQHERGDIALSIEKVKIKLKQNEEVDPKELLLEELNNLSNRVDLAKNFEENT